VVGEARRSTGGFRWTAPDTLTFIGSLTGPRGSSVARGVSGDGTVIVGYSLNSKGRHEAFRWTEDKGMVGLGELFKEGSAGGAAAVSTDGSTIVGSCTSIVSGDTQAFRHTAAGGIVGLGDLPGDLLWSHATAVSADGSIVVGESFTDLPGGGAFIWDETHGMRQLHAVLLDAGLDVAGWTLSVATGISADGRTIIGSGIDPENNYLPWLATLGGPCRADFNRDGVTNSQDFFDFLAAFFAHDPAADNNNDGGVTTEDFFDFLEAFFAGCTR
jgi:probable HAF family extracellular repeat protein